MAIEIVSFPMNSMVIFHPCVNDYQRVVAFVKLQILLFNLPKGESNLWIFRRACYGDQSVTSITHVTLCYFIIAIENGHRNRMKSWVSPTKLGESVHSCVNIYPESNPGWRPTPSAQLEVWSNPGLIINLNIQTSPPCKIFSACIYIYICVYIYVYVYVYVCICICTCMCIYIYLCMCV